ncbi:MAG: hypothetical protein AABZ28_01390, partial [Nitrospinota bacterium]
CIMVFLPLILAVGIGSVRGFFLQEWTTAFQDGNAYLYLFYAIPICFLIWNQSARHFFLQAFAAGVVWNILLSLGILYVFSHFSESFLFEAYRFLRDIRLAEITQLDSGVYRVFIQSQFFTFVFGLLLIPLSFQLKNKVGTVRCIVVFAGVVSVMLLSLSRSFWMGWLVAFSILVVLLLRTGYSFRDWSRFIAVGFSALVLSVVIILCVSLVPFSKQPLGGDELTRTLKTRTQTDVAVSSRWMLLDPMMKKIQEHPILGNGFGSSVTFISDDPRVR